MKKLVLCVFLLFLGLSLTYGGITFAETPPVYVVIANRANVFAEDNLESEVLTTLPHGTEFLEGGEFSLEFAAQKPATYNSSGVEFFKVLFEEKEGYILSEFVALKNNVVESIPNFNAKTNSTCKAYCADGSEVTLQKGHRIYLYQKFNSHSKRTNVVFLYDNKIVYGQIDTRFVDPDGVNPILVSAIIIIVAVLGIIFAWLFMKNRKKKVKIKKTDILS